MSGTKLEFDGTEHLIKYLQENTAGKDILREAVYGRGGEWLEGELSNRVNPTRVLVKIYRDEWVDISGPPRCRATVLFLGRKDTFPAHEIAREQAIRSSLPLPYQSLEKITTAHRGAFRNCSHCGSIAHGSAVCPHYPTPVLILGE